MTHDIIQDAIYQLWQDSTDQDAIKVIVDALEDTTLLTRWQITAVLPQMDWSDPTLTITDVRAWMIEQYNDPEDMHTAGDWDREYRWMVSEGLQYLNRR